MAIFRNLSSLTSILLIVISTKCYCDDNKTIEGPTSAGRQQPNGFISISPNRQTGDEDNIDDGPTLKKDMEEATNNITNKKSTLDSHQFYQPTYISDATQAMSYWVDLSKIGNNTRHEMLSKSHRRAAPVKLSFEFPFYGHPLRNVIIATGGFLYVGEHLHHWLAATQNISPLMANFDLSITNSSELHHYDNGTSFIVQWHNVQMRDNKPPGNFSFQVTLHKSGDIIFVYKHLAVPVNQIPEDDHPVKVGISDAFLMDNVAYFIRRKTIFDYHRLNLKDQPSLGNQTAIYLKALPTCNQYDTCESCAKANTTMECIWCPAVKRCSNGLDRKRQEWLRNECQTIKKSDCSFRTEPPFSSGSSEQYSKPTTVGESTYAGASRQINPEALAPEAREGGTALLSFLVFIGLTAGLGLWVMHAYKNPHTPSGQLLIKYRPSNWRWQAPETRYTAASIHM